MTALVQPQMMTCHEGDLANGHLCRTEEADSEFQRGTGMLTFSADQVSQIGEPGAERFAEQLFNFLCEEYTPYSDRITSDMLKQVIAAAIQISKKYDIATTHELAIIAILVIEHGLSFDQVPSNAWMRQILETNRVDPATCIAHMLCEEQDEP